MDTYSITYFPAGATNPTTLAVQAAGFDLGEDFVLFVDASSPPQVVLAMPRALSPVIQRTAAG